MFEDDMQNLPMQDLIEKYKLYPEVALEEDDHGILINETWTSDTDQDIMLERFYYFDIYFAEFLPTEIKKACFSIVLDIYVAREMYEEAAILRDEIQLL